MSDISPRSLNPGRILSLLLPVSFGGLLLVLSAAPGCCHRAANGSAGVAVTKEVPHSEETIPEIMDRERTDPLPPTGDRAIHPHGIPRTGSDNGACIPPGHDRGVK